MEQLYNLINSKQNLVDSLEAKKQELRNEMQNPRVINENSEQIKDAKRTVSILCDAVELAEELGPDKSAKEILGEVKDHLEEMNEESNGKSPELNKDIKVIENLINKDLNESSSAQQEQEQEQDENISDFNNFDDF